MGIDLFSPEYRKFEVKGNDLNKHFKTKNLKENIDLAITYFAEEFRRRFKIIKLEAYKELAN